MEKEENQHLKDSDPDLIIVFTSNNVSFENYEKLLT